MDNNLQMIHEHEGENIPPKDMAPEMDSNINFIQQQQDGNVDRLPAIEYENDEDELICGRFPHLDVCACDISCQIALKEINLFQVYPGIYMGPF